VLAINVSVFLLETRSRTFQQRCTQEARGHIERQSLSVFIEP
jgi:hypothetical protein